MRLVGEVQCPHHHAVDDMHDMGRVSPFEHGIHNAFELAPGRRAPDWRQVRNVVNFEWMSVGDVKGSLTVPILSSISARSHRLVTLWH